MIAEMSQKLPERFWITSMDSVFSLSTFNERCGVVLIKLSDGDASVLQPLRKMGKQPQFRLHRESRIAIFL